MQARRPMKLSTKEALNGYLFFSPGLIGFLVFMGFPILYSLYLSFTSYNIYSPPKWVGLLNYKFMFTQDPLFYKSLGNTLYYVALSVPLNTVLGVLVAVLMNQKAFGIRVFRTIYFLPSVVSGVAVALLWQWILDGNFGLINTFLANFGIVGPGWLTDELWSKPSMVLMNLWAVGGTMIIYLAGLQGVPRSLYEAAIVDGAGKLRQFWNITIPMLTPTIFFNVIMGVLGGFQVFIQAYIMTGGGPNNSTMFYALYLYNKAFKDLQMGYASALAWVLLLIAMALTLVILKTSSKWVYYEGADSK
ncbi:carbohydrate ABC transporter membrane protein 1 (CUT1 family) [Cohnella sp. SGD-V74]|uniref:carbohydrate ABC transporter permease n=1 Tax=unclassified Cohnella TaxID=2636738 RepID=UPI000D48497E|nr:MULTISPECIES: sugar ABC transporter permease [unclassified Cohnella]PRX73087.1 carbohydrate ABC transporter membrane protein 1 (CUT1 family) [Cohnella sp. SGD-V74]